jgi:hypothetical protein
LGSIARSSFVAAQVLHNNDRTHAVPELNKKRCKQQEQKETNSKQHSFQLQTQWCKKRIIAYNTASKLLVHHIDKKAEHTTNKTNNHSFSNPFHEHTQQRK